MTFDIKPPVIDLKNVYKTYKSDGLDVTALSDISIRIQEQSFSMIVGPSGSGKTTLLNLMGGLDIPTSGKVEICDQDIASMSDDQITDFRSKHIGYIFQNFSLIPVLSAYENVEYPLLLLGVPIAERRRRTMDMLDAVGLADKSRHLPNQLSGGQKQRVGIARALVKEPTIVLADEPTANLDSRTGKSIIQLMKKIQRNHASTFIFSTHDQQLMDYAEETFVILDGGLKEYKPQVLAC